MSYSNIFAGKTVYKSKWELKSVRKFTEEEKLMIKSGSIEEGEFGLRACFFMVGGGVTYQELGKFSRGQAGDNINLDEARILLLERDGEECVKLEL